MSAEKEREYVTALSGIVEHAQGMLESGASALDTVTEAVRQLEECPLFNAGIGSVFTADETHELDACVMDGNSLQAGAVAGVKRLRNPVLAARLVLENSPHVMLIGEGQRLLLRRRASSWSRIRCSPPTRVFSSLSRLAATASLFSTTMRRLMNGRRWAPSARWH